jgi:glycosyltransferase involved in cell wall biosynthesis
MNISIALATYNGEQYIVNQINSILPQLSEGDEIIVSDDGSYDNTLECITNLKNNKIHIFKNPKKGVLTNFENAIQHTKNEIILLCDQDDIWCDNKIDTIKKHFNESNADLIISDAYITDENLNILDDSFYKLMNSGSGLFKNFIKNTFLGCCMAFKSSLKDKILPFPNKIPMHDSWIGLLAELNGKVLFIPDKLVYYRRHDNNASALVRGNLAQTILWRKNLLLELIKRQNSV